MYSIDSLASECGPLCLEAITISRVRIPLVEPFRISSGVVKVKDALLVRVSEGAAYGWGEASAMSGSFYSPETPESCQSDLLDLLVPNLLGVQFESVVELNRHLSQLTRNCFARAAIETAAWELLARRKGVSLRRLLRFPERPVPSGLAVGLYDSEAQFIAAIRRLRPNDYRRLKIKIQKGRDVALVKAVRREWGNIPLFVDANANYSRDDFAVFGELDGFDLLMFEQPLAKGDLEGAAALQKQVRTPVCLDESIETAEDARRASQLGSCRIVNIKLQRVGGFLEALRIAEICKGQGLRLWVGTMPELGVGTAAALVLASHPGFELPTDAEPSRRWYVDDVVQPPIELAEGCILPPVGSGLGYEVDEEVISHHLVQRWSFQSHARPSLRQHDHAPS